MRRCTEKTMRKKGRKWSNISVKKYHHNPVFGVRSGRVKLNNTSSTMELGNTVETYVAPHVCGIHAKFPVIKVEIKVNAAIYTRNSANKGESFRSSASVGFGEARWE